MVASIIWTIDWNPDLEEEPALKREILRALRDDRTIHAIKRYADQAVRECLEDDLESEHLLWLDAGTSYAFFVRVWYETTEEKLFIVVEENDLGDVGFLLLEDHACASYGQDQVLTVEVRDPGEVDLGVPP